MLTKSICRHKVWNDILQIALFLSLSLSLFYEGVKMYNSLPANIKQSDRLKTFKRELKEYIIDRIKYV